MARFDHGGGCACGLQRECDCELSRPKQTARAGRGSRGLEYLMGIDGKGLVAERSVAGPAPAERVAGNKLVRVDDVVKAADDVIQEVGRTAPRVIFLAALRDRLAAL